MHVLNQALLLLSAAAGIASAQGQWKEIGKTASGNSVFVDPRSVKTVNGIITARLRVKFTPPVDVKPGVRWYASRHIAMFDCAKSAFASKETTYYGDEAETKVVEKTVNARPGYSPAFASPMTKLALDYLCKKS